MAAAVSLVLTIQQLLISAVDSSEKHQEPERLHEVKARTTAIQKAKTRQGFFKHQKDSGVRDLLEQRGFEANLDTCASLVRSCSNTRNLADGKRIHAHILGSKYRHDRYLGNLLVEMYGKCTSVNDARRVLDDIAHPNVFSWNIMIAAYAQNGYIKEAGRLFELMPERDVVSWTSMIAAYAQNGQLQEARNLFELIVQPTLVPWNAMISAYTHNGYHEQALALFRRMDLEGMQPNEITFVSILDACANHGALAEGEAIHAHILKTDEFQIDVVLGTALINMYGKCGALEKAKGMFDKLAHKNVVSWTAMVAAYAQNGYLQEALDLFDNMPERNVVSWNAIITAYAQNGECRKAIGFFRKMDLEGVRPDEITFICVLDACASLSAVTEGKAIHAGISNTNYESDIKIATALFHFYGRCGFLQDAREIFENMPCRNAVSWNAMVAAYAQNGHGKEAIEVFRSMGVEGLPPDEATFVAVLSACSHAGLLHDGLGYFVCAENDYGFMPSLDHYVCMIDLLGRASWLDEAEELVNCMPFEPHSVAWMALLSCCKLESDMERGARAAERVFELDPCNSAPYLMLSNIYTAAGNYSGVAKLKRLMKERGILDC